MSDPHRRARRLLRWYPPGWRERYGEEFCALVEREISETSRSARRTVDIAFGGLRSRLEHDGLLGAVTLGEDRRPVGISSIVVGLALFVPAALYVFWSVSAVHPRACGRLDISCPNPGLPIPSPRALQLTLDASFIVAAAAALLAAVPILRHLRSACSPGSRRGVRGPLLLAVGSALVLGLGVLALSIVYPPLSVGSFPFVQNPSPVAFVAFVPSSWLTVIPNGYWFPQPVPPHALVDWWTASSILLFAGAIVGTVLVVGRLRFTSGTCALLAKLGQMLTLVATGVLVAFWWWWSIYAGQFGAGPGFETDGWVPIGLMLVSVVLMAQGSLRAGIRYRRVV